MSDSLTLTPIGGLEEIGKNMLLLEFNEEILIIDCGLKFSSPRDYGANHIINTLEFLRKKKKKIRALLITHGHLDHIGGIPQLLKVISVPIYGSAFTVLMIRKILQAKQIPKPHPLRTLSPGETLQIGASFKVEGIAVDHSIIDSLAFAITTKMGTVIHTGDYRLERTNEKPFSEFKPYQRREQKILCLLTDSTNANIREKSISKAVVLKNLRKILLSCKGRVIIGTFSSQLERIREMMNLARETNRKVCFLGRALQENIEIGLELNYFIEEKDLIIPKESLRSYKEREILLVCTGTQGEENSALYQMAYEKNRWIKVHERDTLIFSSSVVPGNEHDFLRVLNALQKQGVRVITNEEAVVHTSGHANADEIAALIETVRPEYCIPIHGEVRHLLQCKEIALRSGVEADHVLLLENGQGVSFRRVEKKVRLKFPAKLKVRDCFIGANERVLTPREMKERRFLAEGGLLSIALSWERGYTFSVYDRGLCGLEKKSFYASLEDLLKTYEGMGKRIAKDRGKTLQQLKGSVKGLLAKEGLEEAIVLLHVFH